MSSEDNGGNSENEIDYSFNSTSRSRKESIPNPIDYSKYNQKFSSSNSLQQIKYTNKSISSNHKRHSETPAQKVFLNDSNITNSKINNMESPNGSLNDHNDKSYNKFKLTDISVLETEISFDEFLKPSSPLKVK